MTSKSLRRLASDHASLHTQGLPPNYLFPPGAEDGFSDLTSLRVLLAGPEGTAFAQGVYTLDLAIPHTYPQTAPTAHFKTKIFHPNVDPSSGAVCVDTLKRDWKPELTLRHILLTINCLLVYPNPASALNAEAGRLVEEDFAEYERKAHLWARMHAAIPAGLQGAVHEARSRGDKEQVLGAAPGPVARKRKERKVESGDVFVREDSVKTTPPKQLHVMAAPPPPRGLGIDVLPESSLNAAAQQAETPTQQPPRRGKKSVQDDRDDTALPSSSSSFPVSAIPASTPIFRPLVHSNPSTPRVGQPDAKRRRVTPESNNQDVQSTEPAHLLLVPGTQDDGDDDERSQSPWLNWQNLSPLSSPEDEARRKRRRRAEQEKLKRVCGGDLKLYNAGRFGPRKGVERL